MNRAGWLAFLVVGCGAAPVPPEKGSPEIAARVAGDWSGSLQTGGVELHLVVHLQQTPNGWTGTMDSPDQGATGIPLDAIAPTAEGLGFTVPKVHGTYRGAWTDTGGIAGTWTQGVASLQLTLGRGVPAAAKRPQNPVPPLPYAERDLAVDSVPGVKLAGTLSVPPTPGKHAAVVLVTGSGAQDRDESLMGHRPFLVLADAFARAGVVVYRFDDRGTAKSTGTFASATTADFALDAAAAVRAVAALPEVDPARVGVLGHSEGALVAVMTAPQAPVGFVVLMSGPGLSGKAVLESQVEAIARSSGASDADAKKSRATQARILDVLARGGSDAELRAVMKEVGIPDDQIAAQAPTLNSAWYRSFVNLDPGPGLKALKIPVLAVIGDKDVQVVAAENVPALKAALAANPAATVTVLPGLNHLLQPATTGSPSEYGTIETTIDPGALKLLTTWVAAR